MINKNRIGFTKREDGYIISTIDPSFMAWYGKYETAIAFEGEFVWRVAEGYETEEEALEGHKKYVSMTEEEINHINYIG